MDYEEGTYVAYTTGQMIAMEDVKDETFRNKVLGDGIAIQPEVEPQWHQRYDGAR